MKAVAPSARHADDAVFVEIAKDQPEYTTLPAFVDRNGLVLTEWEFSPEDLSLILEHGGKLRLWIHTGGRPLQPVRLEIVA